MRKGAALLLPIRKWSTCPTAKQETKDISGNRPRNLGQWGGSIYMYIHASVCLRTKTFVYIYSHTYAFIYLSCSTSCPRVGTLALVGSGHNMIATFITSRRLHIYRTPHAIRNRGSKESLTLYRRQIKETYVASTLATHNVFGCHRRR